jgi:hypothetical protein
MNESLENEVTQQIESKDLILRVMEMGKLVGMREAFALVAGRCAAADVECLRRLRDDRKFRDLGCSWDEFCAKHLKVSRRSVDRLIARLEEFGPAYFHLTKLTHITASEYRQIAASVSEAGIEIDGAVVTLLPENSDKLSAAIVELLERTNRTEQSDAPKLLEAAPPAELSPAQRIVEACGAIRSILSELHELEYGEMTAVTSAILSMVDTAKRTRLLLFPGM